MKFSPASLYTFVTAAWAGTDLDSMVDYIRAAQAYRHTLVDTFQNTFNSAILDILLLVLLLSVSLSGAFLVFLRSEV